MKEVDWVEKVKQMGLTESGQVDSNFEFKSGRGHVNGEEQEVKCGVGKHGPRKGEWTGKKRSRKLLWAKKGRWFY